MRKTLLMLLLCAPLLWIAWGEARHIYEVSQWTVPAAHPAEDDAARLGEIKARADAVVDLPESVVGTVVRLDPPSPRDHGTSPLEKAVLAHAHARQKGREKVELARRRAADLEEKIEDGLARLRSDPAHRRGRSEELKELESWLNDYGRLDAYDPDLLASARAEAAWPAVDRDHPASEVDALYARLDSWSPGSPPGRAAADDHIAALNAYVEAHRAAKGARAAGLVREASDRLEVWRRGARLAAVLEKPDRPGPPRPPDPPIPGLSPEHAIRLNQIRETIALVEDDPPARFAATARRVLSKLCGDLLKTEPLDDRVLVITDAQAQPEPCSRRAIFIRFKDQTRQSLDRAGFDEYSIPRDRIEDLEYPGGIYELSPNVPPLKGTDYSDAVRAFNVRLRSIKDRGWSAPELMSLKDACEKNESKLAGGPEELGGRTLIGRIDALLTLVRRHPNLFVAATP